MLYLASSSERRHCLLRDAGIDYRAVIPGPEPDLAGSPAEVAVGRAASKARGAAVAAGWVLGADTVVECAGGEIGKAPDRAAAAAILERLSGRSHMVHTALCLVSRPAGRVFEGLATAVVRCQVLQPARIEVFLDTGAWQGKAGAYGIQDPECDFMELLEGELDTVIGLPISLLRGLLARAETPA